jgi:hypothetical protein
MRCAIVLPAILVLACSVPLAAQSDMPTASDTADRPGFADGARVLGRARVQLESGVLFDDLRSGEGAIHTLVLPQAQLRVGISSRIDASIWWDGFVHVSTRRLADRAVTGEADPRVGGKVQLLHRDALDLALVASVGLPIGSPSVSSGDPDPQARLSWAVTLTPALGLSGTLDVGEDRRDRRWRPRPAVSAALNCSLGAQTAAFAGLVAEDGDEGSTIQIWSAEAGLTRELGPRRQIDVWGGRRLAGGSSSWFVGGGFVQRIR